MEFVKMHGLGNDFVVVAGPLRVEAEKISAWCDRRTGIGADGLLVVTPLAPGHVRMEYWNSDGGAAEMCGNGLRCVTRYAVDRGWGGPGKFTVETAVGDLSVEMLDAVTARVEVGRWSVEPEAEMVESHRFRRASVGNPHVVTFVESVDEAPVEELGAMIEEATPGGTNVEFAQSVDDGVIAVRTWERGVGETRACGTGAVAVASVALTEHHGATSATIRLRGGDLQVDLEGDRAWITGPAVYSFSGTW